LKIVGEDLDDPTPAAKLRNRLFLQRNLKVTSMTGTNVWSNWRNNFLSGFGLSAFDASSRRTDYNAPSYSRSNAYNRPAYGGYQNTYQQQLSAPVQTGYTTYQVPEQYEALVEEVAQIEEAVEEIAAEINEIIPEALIEPLPELEN